IGKISNMDGLEDVPDEPGMSSQDAAKRLAELTKPQRPAAAKPPSTCEGAACWDSEAEFARQDKAARQCGGDASCVQQAGFDPDKNPTVEGPKEPYNRRKHYGHTPKKSDRTALNTGTDDVV